MADKKEKFVPNLSGDAAGTVSADGVQTVPLGSEIDALRQGVQKMKELAPPTYTSRNIVAAYQAYMDELIYGYKTIEGGKEITKEPENLLLDALGQRENSTYLPRHLTDVERYFVLLGNILLSGIVEDIDCTMSFIRLSGKMEGDKLINVHGAPYLEKYVEKSKPDTGLHVTEIMRELAGYINGGDGEVPTCAPTDPPSLKADLLPVIYLNGTMVAYYSVASASKFCVYYPFNTIFSANPSGSDSLFGVKSVPPKVDKDKKDKLNTSGYYMWECNIFDFVKRFNKLTDEQQMLFLCSLDSLKDTQIPNKVISAFHTVLQAKGVAVNAAAIAAQTANLASKPLKIVPFKDIPAGIQGEDAQLNCLTLPKSNFRFPMVPDHFKDGTELPKNDYFMALAPSKLHVHAIKAAGGQIRVFVSMDNNDPRPVDMDPGKCNESTPQIDNIQPFTFTINGQDVSSSEGVTIPKTTTVSVRVRYKNMIDLGVVQVSLGTEAPAEMSYDEFTGELRYDYGTKTMQPMLPHYVRLEGVRRKSDLLPVTKEFAKMIVANKYSLKMEEDVRLSEDDDNYTYTITIRVLRDNEDVCKPYIRKTYRTEKREEVLGNLQNMYVPEFSLYPFVKPVDQDGNLLWHQYILTGLHHIKESMIYFLDQSSMTALYEGAAEEKLYFFKQSALKGNYIARTAKLPQIPSGLYMEHDSFNEIGYIVVPKPDSKTCKIGKPAIEEDGRVTVPEVEANKAKLALDMGSRRSVINCQVGSKSNFNFYQENSVVKRLTEIELDPTPENDDAVELMNFLRTLFLEGTHNTDISTFVSSVIQYELEGNVTDEDRTTPFIGGRIIADMSSDFAAILKKVFTADSEARNTANALVELGIFSDFKRKILAEAATGKLKGMDSLFVKDAALHMALNALLKGCTKLEYHYSTPTVTSAQNLKSCWGKVNTNYLQSLLAGCTITIAPPHLESEALYRYYIKGLAGVGHSKYTILIDGGDSTFDISIIEHLTDDAHGSVPEVKRNLSFRYAGQNILVDSIRDVCRRRNATKAQLFLLWNVDLDSPDESELREWNELCGRLFDSGDTISNESWKGEYTKDILYQMIEKFGIDENCDLDQVETKYNRYLGEAELEHSELKEGLHFWEMVLDVIRFKYLTLLRIILLNVQDQISFKDGDDKTIQVLLYGNTNRVAELLWPSAGDADAGAEVHFDMEAASKWMEQAYLNICSGEAEPVAEEETADAEKSTLKSALPAPDVSFEVASQIDGEKKALVEGMVSDNAGKQKKDDGRKPMDLSELVANFDRTAFEENGFKNEVKKVAASYPENENYVKIVNKLAETDVRRLITANTDTVGGILRTLGLAKQEVQINSLNALTMLQAMNNYLTHISMNGNGTELASRVPYCDYADATFFS